MIQSKIVGTLDSSDIKSIEFFKDSISEEVEPHKFQSREVPSGRVRYMIDGMERTAKFAVTQQQFDLVFSGYAQKAIDAISAEHGEIVSLEAIAAAKEAVIK